MGSSCRSTPTVASGESTSPTDSTRRRSFLPSSSSTFPSRTRASSSTSRCRCSSSATTTRWVKWRRLATDNRVENPIWSHFVERIFTFRRMIKTHQNNSARLRWNPTMRRLAFDTNFLNVLSALKLVSIARPVTCEKISLESFSALEVSKSPCEHLLFTLLKHLSSVVTFSINQNLHYLLAMLNCNKTVVCYFLLQSFFSQCLVTLVSRKRVTILARVLVEWTFLPLELRWQPGL